MPVVHVKGNILDWPAGIRVIVHGCNLQRRFGAGLAAQIAEEYPTAKDAYLKAFELADEGKSEMPTLGCLIVAEVAGGKRIINAITQTEVGTHKVQLDMPALRSVLTQVRTLLEGAAKEGRTWVLGIPKWIGCGLAGGNAAEVEALVNELFAESVVKCVVVERVVRRAAAKESS